MKRAALLLIGFLPLLLFGFLLNHLMMTVFFDTAAPYFLISITVLAVWFVFGIISIKLSRQKREAIVLLNAPAFFVLLLLLFQEIILHRYWFNIIGRATQFFYLPLIRLGSALNPFRMTSIPIIAIISFICLCAVSYLGAVVAGRHVNQISIK